ncbi:unnamed protein product, partial [Closterium sp. NIES-64]
VPNPLLSPLLLAPSPSLLSFHSLCMHVPRPLTCHGLSRATASHVPRPLTCHGLSRATASHVPRPLTCHGLSRATASHVPLPLTCHGLSRATASHVPLPLTCHGLSRATASHVPRPLTCHCLSRATASHVPRPLTCHGLSRATASHVPRPLTCHCLSRATASHVPLPLTCHCLSRAAPHMQPLDPFWWCRRGTNILLGTLARDLQHDFLPFLPLCLDACLRLLQQGADRDAAVLQQVVECVAQMGKHLRHYLTPDIVTLLKMTKALRFYPADYVRELVAHSLAFVLRTAPPNRWPAVRTTGQWDWKWGWGWGWGWAWWGGGPSVRGMAVAGRRGEGVRWVLAEARAVACEERESGVALLLANAAKGPAHSLHSKAAPLLLRLLLLPSSLRPPRAAAAAGPASTAHTANPLPPHSPLLLCPPPSVSPSFCVPLLLCPPPRVTHPLSFPPAAGAADVALTVVTRVIRLLAAHLTPATAGPLLSLLLTTASQAVQGGRDGGKGGAGGEDEGKGEEQGDGEEGEEGGEGKEGGQQQENGEGETGEGVGGAAGTAGDAGEGEDAGREGDKVQHEVVREVMLLLLGVMRRERRRKAGQGGEGQERGGEGEVEGEGEGEIARAVPRWEVLFDCCNDTLMLWFLRQLAQLQPHVLRLLLPPTMRALNRLAASHPAPVLLIFLELAEKLPDCLAGSTLQQGSTSLESQSEKGGKGQEEADGEHAGKGRVRKRRKRQQGEEGSEGSLGRAVAAVPRPPVAAFMDSHQSRQQQQEASEAWEGVLAAALETHSVLLSSHSAANLPCHLPLYLSAARHHCRSLPILSAVALFLQAFPSWVYVFHQVEELESAPYDLQMGRHAATALAALAAHATSARLPNQLLPAVSRCVLGLLHSKFAMMWQPAIGCLAALLSAHPSSTWLVVWRELRHLQGSFLLAAAGAPAESGGGAQGEGQGEEGEDGGGEEGGEHEDGEDGSGSGAGITDLFLRTAMAVPSGAPPSAVLSSLLRALRQAPAVAAAPPLPRTPTASICGHCSHAACWHLCCQPGERAAEAWHGGAAAGGALPGIPKYVISCCSSLSSPPLCAPFVHYAPRIPLSPRTHNGTGPVPPQLISPSSLYPHPRRSPQADSAYRARGDDTRGRGKGRQGGGRGGGGGGGGEQSKWFLVHPDPAVQQLALECLVAWRHGCLPKYAARLAALASYRSLKETLTTWDISPVDGDGEEGEEEEEGRVAEADRASVIPVIIRLLLPKLKKRSGQLAGKVRRVILRSAQVAVMSAHASLLLGILAASTVRSAPFFTRRIPLSPHSALSQAAAGVQRGTVLTFLARLPPSELLPLFHLMLLPFRPALRPAHHPGAVVQGEAGEEAWQQALRQGATEDFLLLLGEGGDEGEGEAAGEEGKEGAVGAGAGAGVGAGVGVGMVGRKRVSGFLHLAVDVVRVMSRHQLQPYVLALLAVAVRTVQCYPPLPPSAAGGEGRVEERLDEKMGEAVEEKEIIEEEGEGKEEVEVEEEEEAEEAEELEGEEGQKDEVMKGKEEGADAAAEGPGDADEDGHKEAGVDAPEEDNEDDDDDTEANTNASQSISPHVPSWTRELRSLALRLLAAILAKFPDIATRPSLPAPLRPLAAAARRPLPRPHPPRAMGVLSHVVAWGVVEREEGEEGEEEGEVVLQWEQAGGQMGGEVEGVRVAIGKAVEGHLAAILPHMQQFIARQGALYSSKGAGRALKVSALAVVGRMAGMVTHAHLAGQLAAALTPFLRQAAGGRRRVDESTTAAVLAVLQSLAPLLSRTAAATCVRLFAPLVTHLQSRPARLALVHTALSALAAAHPSHSMRLLASLVADLCAYDPARIDEYDYTRRLHAYTSMHCHLPDPPATSTPSSKDSSDSAAATALQRSAEQVQQQVVVAVGREGCLLLLSCAVRDMADEDMSLRHSAAHFLQSFVRLAAALAALPPAPGATAGARKGREGEEGGAVSGREARELVNAVLLRHIKKGLHSPIIVVRREWVLLLRDVALHMGATSPVAELRCLVREDDVEADFFHNLVHLQTHRRVRALTKFAALCPHRPLLSGMATLHWEYSSTPSEVLLEAVVPALLRQLVEGRPDSESGVMDATMAALSALAARLPWPAFHSLLSRLLALLPRRKEKGRAVRAILRAICGVLEQVKHVVGVGGGEEKGDKEEEKGEKEGVDGKEGGEAGGKDGDEGKEITDKESKGGKEEIRPSGSSGGREGGGGGTAVSLRIQQVLLKDIIPQLSKHLVAGEAGREEVKLACGARRDAHAAAAAARCHPLAPPRAPADRRQPLKSRSQGTRDAARAALCQVAGGRWVRPTWVAVEGLLGQVAEEREVDAVAAGVREKRQRPVAETVRIAASLVNVRRSTALLLAPSVPPLPASLDPRVKRHVQEMVRHMAIGLLANQHATAGDLLVLVHAVLWEGRARGAGTCGPHCCSPSPRTIRLPASDPPSHRGLNALVHPLSLALSSPHPTPWLAASFRALAFLLHRRPPLRRHPLPPASPRQRSGGAAGGAGGGRGGRHGALVSEAASRAARQIAPGGGGREEQVRALLGSAVFTDLELPSTRTTAFAVSARAAAAASGAAALLLAFLLDYPLGPARLEAHLSFLIVNLKYEHQSGREAVLGMLRAIIEGFPSVLVEAHADTFFLPLVTRLVSDESARVRQLVAAVLKALFVASQAAHVRAPAALRVCMVWWIRPPQLQQAAALVLGVAGEAGGGGRRAGGHGGGMDGCCCADCAAGAGRGGGKGREGGSGLVVELDGCAIGREGRGRLKLGVATAAGQWGGRGWGGGRGEAAERWGGGRCRGSRRMGEGNWNGGYVALREGAGEEATRHIALGAVMKAVARVAYRVKPIQVWPFVCCATHTLHIPSLCASMISASTLPSLPPHPSPFPLSLPLPTHPPPTLAPMHGAHQTAAALRCVAALATALGGEGVRPYLPDVMLPLFRLSQGSAGAVVPREPSPTPLHPSVPFAIPLVLVSCQGAVFSPHSNACAVRSTAEVQGVVGEVVEHVRHEVGPAAFIAAFSAARDTARRRAAARREAARVSVLVDPERHARRRASLARKRGEYKKRKNQQHRRSKMR